MNDAPLLDPDVGKLAERQVLAVRCRDQQVLDRVHALPERLLQPNDEVERSLPLDHLASRRLPPTAVSISVLMSATFRP